MSDRSNCLMWKPLDKSDNTGLEPAVSHKSNELAVNLSVLQDPSIGEKLLAQIKREVRLIIDSVTLEGNTLKCKLKNTHRLERDARAAYDKLIMLIKLHKTELTPQPA